MDKEWAGWKKAVLPHNDHQNATSSSSCCMRDMRMGDMRAEIQKCLSIFGIYIDERFWMSIFTNKKI